MDKMIIWIEKKPLIFTGLTVMFIAVAFFAAKEGLKDFDRPQPGPPLPYEGYIHSNEWIRDQIADDPQFRKEYEEAQ